MPIVYCQKFENEAGFTEIIPVEFCNERKTRMGFPFYKASKIWMKLYSNLEKKKKRYSSSC